MLLAAPALLYNWAMKVPPLGVLATVVVGSAIAACTDGGAKDTGVATVGDLTTVDAGLGSEAMGSVATGTAAPSATPGASEANIEASASAAETGEPASAASSGDSAATSGALTGIGGSGVNSAPAGGSAGVESSGSSGAAGASAGSANVGGAGGAGPSGVGGDVDVGSLPNDPSCPASLEEAFPLDSPAVCPADGLECHVPVECNSGAVELRLACVAGEWEGASGCDEPYDFCPETHLPTGGNAPNVYCVDGEWQIEADLRGVADGFKPCPNAAPAEAEPCEAYGGTGGADRSYCGYPCANDPTKWTVFSCLNPENYLSSKWQSDSACK
jgi:hypothetical protein